MTKFSIAALAAVVVAGIAPAQAESLKCDEGVKSFFERLQLNGSAMTSRGDKLADVMRRTVRAYDACKAAIGVMETRTSIGQSLLKSMREAA